MDFAYLDIARICYLSLSPVIWLLQRARICHLSLSLVIWLLQRARICHSAQKPLTQYLSSMPNTVYRSYTIAINNRGSTLFSSPEYEIKSNLLIRAIVVYSWTILLHCLQPTFSTNRFLRINSLNVKVTHYGIKNFYITKQSKKNKCINVKQNIKRKWN